MSNKFYHYTECGLNDIYLVNGYKSIDTEYGKAVSVKDVDGLHKTIGHFLILSKKDFMGEEIRFLRHEMLMSQNTLACLLGVREQTVRRWENNKINIPKPTESLLRLIYREKVNNWNGCKITEMLKKIADLEDIISGKDILFEDTQKGWQNAV